MIDDRKPLLRRLRTKLTRYGDDLGAPYVIALSGSTFTTDEIDLADSAQ